MLHCVQGNMQYNTAVVRSRHFLKRQVLVLTGFNKSFGVTITQSHSTVDVPGVGHHNIILCKKEFVMRHIDKYSQ